jgi:myosin-5
VYETSSLAYRGLAVEGEHQSILVSGESGAGKTETVKILLSDLASVQRGHKHRACNGESPIVQRVLDSNPLLEAFGNAKTARNDNSSRFGKYIMLQFDAEDAVNAAFAGTCVPSCVLAGSKCDVYLLEKSRVTIHEAEERTYHIFYQLLAADEALKLQFWEGLEDTDNESYSYVGFTETDSIEGKTDAERFQHTIKSLQLIGIEGETLKLLMRTICVVLQLGNLVFEADEEDQDRSKITSLEDFAALSDLMGVSEEDLLAALTIRTMRARNEEFKVPLNAVQAKDSCDAFAKEIYAKTFLWLVRSINAATAAELNYEGGRKKKGYGIIGMLDIFGFESFETNRFEQLCINYANEKLQQKFTQDVFRSVQAEYEYEGIELVEITYDDNSDVLDLIEGRMGLLACLNEECVRPGGNDKSFVSKAKAVQKECHVFGTEAHYSVFEFDVVHYAGPVVYDAEFFVTKNMDTLPTDLQECAGKSTNSILSNELTNEAVLDAILASPEPSKAKKPKKVAPNARLNLKRTPQKKQGNNLVGETVWTKFKNQLTDLMETLKTTRSRYIRCIKPNTNKEPLVMQHLSTVEQLRCAGVVAAVTISRSAFPNRLEHDIVLDRFKSCWQKGEHLAAIAKAEESDDIEERNCVLTDIMLSSALKGIEVEREGLAPLKAFVIGRSRAYFRAGALEYLENERVKALSVWATEIQKMARKFLDRTRYLRACWLCLRLQSYARMYPTRKMYRRMRKGSLTVSNWYRCILARRNLVKRILDHKATLIQTHWRIGVARAYLKTQRKAAIVVQTMVRGSLQRPKYRIALQEKKDEAKLENQVRALQRKLEEAEARRIETEKMAESRALAAADEARTKAEEVAAKAAQAREKEWGGSVASPAAFLPVPPSPGVPAIVEVTSICDVGSAAAKSIAEASQQQIVQQQTLMDESGKMLEYLRKEVFKLRSQNSQIRSDFDLLKDNNQRLMDANASAGASFAALNQHAKQLSKVNEKLTAELQSAKQQQQKSNVLNIELREELKMKQATYVAEIHSRLQYQKALASIVDVVQDKCRDTRLVEKILGIADSCEQEYMSDPAQRAPSAQRSDESSPDGKDESSGLMSSIRNLWY